MPLPTLVLIAPQNIYDAWVSTDNGIIEITKVKGDSLQLVGSGKRNVNVNTSNFFDLGVEKKKNKVIFCEPGSSMSISLT